MTLKSVSLLKCAVCYFYAHTGLLWSIALIFDIEHYLGTKYSHKNNQNTLEIKSPYMLKFGSTKFDSIFN